MLAISHLLIVAVGENFLSWHSLLQFSSVHSVMPDSLRPHESQHARPPCPSPTPQVHSNSCPSSQRCHPAISSSVVPFSSCPQALPASGSCPMSQLFAWGGQSTGVSALASFLPKNTQDWSPNKISIKTKHTKNLSSILHWLQGDFYWKPHALILVFMSPITLIVSTTTYVI